jgi:hypothetical protein
MDLADRLEGQYPNKTLSLMHGAVLPERSDSFVDVLDYYAEFKQTGYGATDHRLKVRIAKCKADLIECSCHSKQPLIARLIMPGSSAVS